MLIGEVITQKDAQTMQIIPSRADHGLRPAIAQVYHDEVSLAVLVPRPGNDVPAGRVIGPPCALAKTPLAFAKHRTINGRQKLVIEADEFGIDRLIRAPAQENRQTNFTAFELSLVEHSR